MKKLIAISLAFILSAGLIFAETSISASIETRWNIISGATDGNGTALSGGSAVGNGSTGIHAGTFQLAGSNDDGNYGAVFKFEFTPGLNPFNRAIVWWEPIDQLRLFLGQDGDGMFNTANLSRWGHHQMDRGISLESWQANNYLLGNWDNFGLAAIIKNLPVDGLGFNIALNLPTSAQPVGFSNDSTSKYGKEAWRQFQIQAVYNFDYGTITAIYQNADMTAADGKLGLVFANGGLIPDVSFEIGGSYALEEEAVNFALGLHYSGGDFGVKVRGFFDIDDSADAGLTFRADIMPWYQFEFAQLLCNIHLRLLSSGDLGWHINPYLRARMGGGHDFRVGLMIADYSASSEIEWKIATSMLFAF